MLLLFIFALFTLDFIYFIYSLMINMEIESEMTFKNVRKVFPIFNTSIISNKRIQVKIPFQWRHTPSVQNVSKEHVKISSDGVKQETRIHGKEISLLYRVELLSSLLELSLFASNVNCFTQPNVKINEQFPITKQTNHANLCVTGPLSLQCIIWILQNITKFLSENWRMTKHVLKILSASSQN